MEVWSVIVLTARPARSAASVWRHRYASKHRPIRIESFPSGVSAPQRVRIYRRGAYYLLHFWDPAVKRTLYDRVDGDLIDAIAKARQIDQRLENFRSSGQVSRRVGHQELVDLFRQDLDRRADASGIACTTARRYNSALKHYINYVSRPEVAAAYSYAGRADRTFALGFSTYLGTKNVTPNGR
jgi:hypothetical protein